MTLCGYIACKRGMCQGDPLSPLLFCLAEEMLSRGITSLVENNNLIPMASPRNFGTPTHILYADDIFVFCRGAKKNITILMTFFHSYREVSGQLIVRKNVNSFMEPYLI